jgi:UPF0176 protein
MKILTIAGYKFISLYEIETLRSLRFHFLEQCQSLNLKGTILLSKEGININLAGRKEAIQTFITLLKNDLRFADITFHQTYSFIPPFKRLKIKLKNEIITLRQPLVNPLNKRAKNLTPATLKQWLDEKRDITLLDTRNDYEVQLGTFRNAVQLSITDFCQFPQSLHHIKNDKPLVMFCTGGIRCEKAALYLLQHGYSTVYQLEGGILGYFTHVGGAHYEGDCFVFDDRVSVDTQLNSSKLRDDV